MPIPSLFQTGGIPDEPDERTRAIAFRAMMPNLTVKDSKRLAARDSVMAENFRTANGGASVAPAVFWSAVRANEQNAPGRPSPEVRAMFERGDAGAGTTPPAIMGLTPERPGGGWGASGPIDVRSYAGSRYDVANMFRNVGRRPTENILKGTPLDINARIDNEDIRRQMTAAEFQQMTASTARINAARAEDEAGKRAIADALGGGSSVGMTPQATAYLRSGGTNGQIAHILNTPPKEQWGGPRFIQGDAIGGAPGSLVFQDTPHSARVVPDGEAKKKPKYDEPQLSKDGKFFRSGPEDDWKPVRGESEMPTMQELLGMNMLLKDPEAMKLWLEAKGKAGSPPKAAAPAGGASQESIPVLTRLDEMLALPNGSKFIYNGVIHTRKKA